MTDPRGTYVLLNHVQDKYLDARDPDNVALRQKINDFVEEIRPHVKGIIWSYAKTSDMNGNGFNLDNEKQNNPAFREGDAMVTNNDGKGLDSGFLQDISKINPGKIILAGLYFEACSIGTATTLRESFGIPVAVPMELANAPERPFEAEYHSAGKRMEAIKIDVRTTAAGHIEAEKNNQILSLGSGFVKPSGIAESPMLATNSKFSAPAADKPLGAATLTEVQPVAAKPLKL
ncbi:MAG: hypothetical protein PW788_06260 [Micavibrio sp.]|nr:hypothetical protein [Micavibrio sp.]